MKLLSAKGPKGRNVRKFMHPVAGSILAPLLPKSFHISEVNTQQDIEITLIGNMH